MRTRRFANTERIRAKERRLLEVLRRKQAALNYSMFPAGPVRYTPTITAPTAGATVTVQTPLVMLVPTSGEVWQVDFDEIPDSTGGFGDVTIPSAKQIAELADNAVLSLTGQSVGEYIVYAQHVGQDENPEEREPPSKYAGGTGAYQEHRDFFDHVHVDGTPIPREGYDSTLEPEIVSEYVDRLTLAIASSGSVPSNGVPILSVTWDGTGIVSTTNLYALVRVDDVRDGGVTAAKIASNAVTTSKIADRAVTSDKIALGGVIEDRIGAGAVTLHKIADGAVVESKIGTGAVTQVKLAASSVGETQMRNNSVSSRTIVDNAATKAKIRPFQYLYNGLFFGSARMSGSGTVLASHLPDGWQMERVGVGGYTVTYPDNYIPQFIGAAGDDDNTYGFAQIAHDRTNRTITVNILTSAVGDTQSIDLSWSFFVIGYDLNG